MPSIRTFASRIPQPLLLRFLHSHSIELSHGDLTGSPTAVSDTIERAVTELSRSSRGRFAQEIEAIDRLANEAGQFAIGEVTIPEELAGLQTNHARALWLYLQDQRRFRQAEDVVYANAHRYTRMWDSFDGPEGVDVRRDAAALEAFKAALQESFQTPNVHIEIIDRVRASETHAGSENGGQNVELVQFTIYREGPANAEFAFVDSQLTTEIRSPVIEAAITYNTNTGVIECVARRKETRADIVQAFGVTLLGRDSTFQPRSARSYDLTVLQDRIEFPTDPIDGIEDVSVALLKLYPVETTSERVTIEKLSETDRDIWNVVETRLGSDALKSAYRIAQATIQITYRSPGRNRPRKLPITITHPHRSNIKDQTEIERVVASKYLQRWGLLARA